MFTGMLPVRKPAIYELMLSTKTPGDL